MAPRICNNRKNKGKGNSELRQAIIAERSFSAKRKQGGPRGSVRRKLKIWQYPAQEAGANITLIGA